MRNYNKRGNAKKEKDFVVLERDIKYAKDDHLKLQNLLKQEFSRNWPSFRRHL
jgi:hypothetical protein